MYLTETKPCSWNECNAASQYFFREAATGLGAFYVCEAHLSDMLKKENLVYRYRAWELIWVGLNS